MPARLRIVGQCAPRRCVAHAPPRGEHGRESAAPIHDSQVISTYAGRRDQYLHDPRAWQRPEDLGRAACVGAPGRPRGRPPLVDLRAVTSRPPRSRATTRPRPARSTPVRPARRARAAAVRAARQAALARYVEPAEIEPTGLGTTSARRDRSGTQDLGLMLLRVGRRCAADRARPAEGVRLVGRSGPERFPATRLADMGYQHADILTYVGGRRPDRAPACCWSSGLFTPLAAAGALAYLVNAPAGRGDGAPHDEARLSAFLHRRARVRGDAARRGRRDRPDRARAGTGWTPVAAGPVGRSSDRSSR